MHVVQVISANIQKRLVRQDEIIYVDLTWQENIDQTHFSIRPICDSANVFIHNPVNDVWVSSMNALSEMPPLQSRMYIKLSHLLQSENLWFELRNIKTSEVYKTNEITIWPYEEFAKNYFTTLVLQDVSTPDSKKIIPVINNIVSEQPAYKPHLDYKALCISIFVFVVVLLIMRKWLYVKKVVASNGSNDSNISSIVDTWRSDKLRGVG